MADMAQVAQAVAAAIANQKEYITAQLQSVGPYSLETILDYWKPAPDGNSYPLIMLQHISEQFHWYSLQNNYINIFQLDIYGMLRGTDPEVMARSTEKMAGAIKTILLQRSMSIVLENSESLVYVDQNGRDYCPVEDARYIEILSNQGQLSRGFRMRFQGSVISGIPDLYASVNRQIQPQVV